MGRTLLTSSLVSYFHHFHVVVLDPPNGREALSSSGSLNLPLGLNLRNLTLRCPFKFQMDQHDGEMSTRHARW